MRRGLYRRARALAPRGWATIAGAWWLLAWVRAALRVQSPARLIAWATSTVPRPTAPPARDARHAVRRVARCTAIAARWHALPMHCLPQSLVVSRLLARRGIATRIQFGANVDDARFAAHAWTLWGDRVVTGSARAAATLVTLEPVAASAVRNGRADV